MLRIKSEKISVQFITLAVLCLCYGLMIYLSLPPAYAALSPQPPQPPYYIVDADQTPCIVYRIVNRKPSIFFKRRSGTISSIAFWRGQLYFCPANDKRIYVKKPNEPERIVFIHNTYVRDVAIDPSGSLYFTEANGAKSDGRIYKLTPPVDKLGSKGFSRQSRQPFYTVQLKTVDGFWAGDFTFDAQRNLYLSSGNRTPASIYRVLRVREGQYGSPERRIYKDSRGSIKGIAIDPRNSNFIYYANWGRTIYRLNIDNSRRSVAFSGNVAKSRNPHLSDVALDIRSPRRN